MKTQQIDTRRSQMKRMKLNSPPCLSTFNIMNSGLMNPIIFCYEILHSIILSYFRYLPLCKLSCSYSIPSSLAKTVLCIIAKCSNKQMMGTNARWRVTMVKYTQSVWNGMFVKFPRYAVCKFWTMLNLNVSITSWASKTYPQPTTCCGFHADSVCKSFCKGLCDRILVRHAIPPYQDRVFRPSGEPKFSLGRFFIITQNNRRYV
jgi:hypothetical protein